MEKIFSVHEITKRLTMSSQKTDNLSIEFGIYDLLTFTIRIRLSQEGLDELKKTLKQYRGRKDCSQWSFVKKCGLYEITNDFTIQQVPYVYFNQKENEATLIMSKDTAECLKEVISGKPVEQDELGFEIVKEKTNKSKK